MNGRPPYVEGRVHVSAELCATCVFRPGNLMRLLPGRLAGMIRSARRAESAIVCHQTTHGQADQQVVCRGFYDRYPTQPLQVAARLGLVTFVPSPSPRTID